MKKTAYILLATVALAALAAQGGGKQTPGTPGTADDWTACIEQYKVKWGDEDCSQCHSFADTYKVFLRNICSDSIDVKCCVQEKSRKWRCFTWYQINSNDSVSAYACIGTGKYMWWSRRAGDKSIQFPASQEVNAEYRD